MSCSRGSNERKRPQKYKNKRTFKNDLHDKTVTQKKINSLHVCEVCQHCKGVIEWKIKYKKYKPLSQPKTCVKCQQKNVRKAYHVLCRDCAINERLCAKCLESWDKVSIEPADPTPEEELKLKVEMDRLIKAFPERKRRTFLRFMEKGKKVEDESDDESNNDDDNDDSDEPKLVKKIPYTRDELLEKIKQLTVVEEFDDELSCDDSSDNNEDSDNSELEENNESENKDKT